MSRIRTIKPEFWTSEQVISCSPHARLLYIGLWNFCDDNGVHPASLVRIKAEIFPGDDFSTSAIHQWIDQLISNNLLCAYSDGDKPYWLVTGWKNHQRIDKPNYRYPLPKKLPDKMADDCHSQQPFCEYAAISRPPFDDYSANDRRPVADHLTTEWNEKEWKRVERYI